MPFTENLAAFMSPLEFGTQASYTPAGGEAGMVNGIFDDAYAEALGAFEGSAPAFTLPRSDVPDVARGDLLTINGVDYKVTNVRPDGLGMVTLHLQEQ